MMLLCPSNACPPVPQAIPPTLSLSSTPAALVTTLYEAYQPRIRSYLLGKLSGQRAACDLAEDLTQLTFVRLWKALQRGVCFQTEAQACHYLHAIAANLLRDQWRQDQQRREVPLP